MYTCGDCGKTTAAKQKMLRRVTKTRNVEYPERAYKHKRDMIDDPGGVGFETVTEIPVCEKCALKLEIGPRLI